MCILSAGCVQKKEKEFHMTTSDFGSDVSHCIGRYQISLPTGFVMNSGSVGEFHPQSMSSDEPAINLEIVAYGTNVDSFKARVQKRIAELREEKKGSGLDYLAAMQSLGDDLVKLRVGNVENFYRSEIHALKGKSYIIASLESSDNQYEVAENRLREFVAGIVMTDSSGDTGKGFCIGPLTINGDFKREWYQFGYRSVEKPDVVISVDVDTFSKDDPETLFDRVSGPSSLLSIFGVKHSVLRKREVIVSGMQAQEWLGAARLPERNDKKLSFALETVRQTPSLMAPKIHVGFDSGENGLDGAAHETSMTEDEAVDQWDRLVASIRPRELSR